MNKKLSVSSFLKANNITRLIKSELDTKPWKKPSPPLTMKFKQTKKEFMLLFILSWIKKQSDESVFCFF